ncbi:MAG TPA: DUF4082 domain-containing protein [Pseudonocardiaceae bacterium]
MRRRLSCVLIACLGLAVGSPAAAGHDGVSTGAPVSTAAGAEGPSVAFTGPDEGATVPGATAVAVSGTATGAAPISIVELSVDGGATWVLAGTGPTWSHTWVPDRPGPAQLRARATDALGNVGPVAGRAVTVGPQTCPCTVFGPAVPAPAHADSGDGTDVELGLRFSSAVNATVIGVRFHADAAGAGPHTVSLWSGSGRRLATGSGTGGATAGWRTVTFDAPVGIRAGAEYVASYHAPNGHYAAEPARFARHGAGVGPLTAPAGVNGVFRFGAGFPTLSHNSTNYWVDPVVGTDGVDVTPPALTSRTPAPDATAVPTDAELTATLDEDVDVDTASITVTAGGVPVPGATAVDGRTVTFVPGGSLAPGTAHAVTLDAADATGNSVRSTWSFTTGSGPASCPCTILRSARPAVADAGDDGDVVLGVRFTTDRRLLATGVRFFRSAANRGPHTGTLWTADGRELATGTFPAGTSTGWQTLTFARPVPLAAHTTYVASYRAPNGHYAADLDAFATTGAGHGPVVAPSSPAAGGNGVFQYHGGFPTNTFRAANYWVDVVVDTAGVDVTPPAVLTRDPAVNATGVPTHAGVTATFDEEVDPLSVSVTLTGPAGPVAGTTRVGDDGRSVAFAPDLPLDPGTPYAVTVASADPGGNAGATTWDLTTGAASCPCTLFTVAEAPEGTDAGAAVELGTRWRSDEPGLVTGIRFAKVPGDPGPHTGTLWSASGVPLATGTFTAGSASGWQTLVLDPPVRVAAGTDYVVSYHSAAGRYGYTRDFLATGHRRGPLTASAGLYRYGPGGAAPTDDGGGTGYWVDVVLTPDG